MKQFRSREAKRFAEGHPAFPHLIQDGREAYVLVGRSFFILPKLCGHQECGVGRSRGGCCLYTEVQEPWGRSGHILSSWGETTAVALCQLGWPELCGRVGQSGTFAHAVLTQVPGALLDGGSGGATGHHVGVLAECRV